MSKSKKPPAPEPRRYVFCADGPGQSERIRIGDVCYELGKTYEDVPWEHLAKGGFEDITSGPHVIRNELAGTLEEPPPLDPIEVLPADDPEDAAEPQV